MGTEMIWSQKLAGPGQEDTFSTRIQGQPKQHSQTSSTGKNDNKSGEISQLAKTLAAKPDKLNSIPITQGGGKKEQTNGFEMSSDLHECAVAQPPTPTQTKQTEMVHRACPCPVEHCCLLVRCCPESPSLTVMSLHPPGCSDPGTLSLAWSWAWCL